MPVMHLLSEYGAACVQRDGGAVCLRCNKAVSKGSDVTATVVDKFWNESDDRCVKTSAPTTVGPIPMRLNCPDCGELHIDEGEFAIRVHHTHACQHCGAVWRPAIVPTVGVRFLPGFKNEGAS